LGQPLRRLRAGALDRPRARARHERRRPGGEPARERRPLRRRAPEARAMSPASKLVMVVDDDEALRESICELLEEDGFRTVWADSGATALGHLRSGAVP